MTIKYALIAAFFIAATSIAWADEVIVPAGDRDRFIRLDDGRQVHLPAGSELVRTNDGRLMTRSYQPIPDAQNSQKAGSGAAQQPARNAQNASQKDGAQKDSGYEFVGIFYAGVTAGASFMKHEWDIQTINAGVPFEFEGGSFSADGSGVMLSKSRSHGAYGLTLGVKDARERNYYEASIIRSFNLTELYLSGALGLSSLSFAQDKVEPYLRILAGVGFEGRINAPDSYAFGLGTGLNYALNKDWEFALGADYITRGFVEKDGFTSSSGMRVKYGTIDRKEHDIRVMAAARYLFN